MNKDITKLAFEAGQALAAADTIRHVSSVTMDLAICKKLDQAHAMIREALKMMTSNIDSHESDCPAVDGFGCRCGE